MINDFKTTNKNNSYYDLYDDYELIESSFAQQYGIRLRNEEDMSWDEFVNLLSGINGDTPLGAVVRIRSEKDPKVMKNWGPNEKKIHRDWQKKIAENMTKEEFDNQMQMFSNMFRAISMSQKINKKGN